jgi:hypothetical protein
MFERFKLWLAPKSNFALFTDKSQTGYYLLLDVFYPPRPPRGHVYLKKFKLIGSNSAVLEVDKVEPSCYLSLNVQLDRPEFFVCHLVHKGQTTIEEKWHLSGVSVAPIGKLKYKLNYKFKAHIRSEQPYRSQHKPYYEQVRAISYPQVRQAV